jgi:hypothetical protein
LKHFSAVRSYTLTPLAETGDRFSDFSPYVASINDVGTVFFQAAISGGGAGIFNATGEQIRTVIDTANTSLADICSHPDTNRNGDVTFYADLKSGGGSVIRISADRLTSLEETGDPFKHIGPLGPTINDQGSVTFRADMMTKHSGIFCSDKGATIIVARTGDRISGFHGLPVINNQGVVVFRADLVDGSKGIFIVIGGVLETIADTTGLFSDLGLFPIINDAGVVAFNATLKSGKSGIFTVKDGLSSTIVDSDGPFESFRGALINNPEKIIFYATPNRGTLGIYYGPDPDSDRILAIGDPMLSSTVSEFALNPVSINNAGQLAIRVKLDDNRQVILRADPVF